MLTTSVTTRIAKATRFIKRSLLSIEPREGIELPITVQTKTLLLSLDSWSWRLGMEVLRSTESLIPTPMKVREVALREKNLQGNQNFRWRKPWRRSAAMASAQRSEAIATYKPIEGIGLLNSASFKTPWESHPRVLIGGFSIEKLFLLTP